MLESGMTESIDSRLAKLGITLPSPAAPIAAYVPAVEVNGFLYISGLLIAQMKKALGSLDRVERIVKLGAFVCCDPAFKDQPSVANGGSELMEKVFGEAGKHARSAVGVPALPRGAAVEIDAIVAVRAG